MEGCAPGASACDEVAAAASARSLRSPSSIVCCKLPCGLGTRFGLGALNDAAKLGHVLVEEAEAPDADAPPSGSASLLGWTARRTPRGRTARLSAELGEGSAACAGGAIANC